MFLQKLYRKQESFFFASPKKIKKIFSNLKLEEFRWLISLSVSRTPEWTFEIIGTIVELLDKS